MYLAVTGVTEVERKHLIPAMRMDAKTLKFHGILCASTQTERLKKNFEEAGKKFYGIEWYPSCTETEYRPVNPKRLFYCGFQWDNKRNGLEYQKMFALLDRQGYLDIYGPLEKWEYAKNAVRGMSFDPEILSKAMREAGVTLILHTQTGLNLSSPSARIFEAASACTVIISDRHPFIVREFEDNVLYIDDSNKGEELFDQINKHFQWILAHPKEAEGMARKAHAIFLKKFTLEKHLQSLIEMHETILKDKSAGCLLEISLNYHFC
jgi:glycosyltransferase involved in cell wall biosynthesis